jgi:transposase
MAHLTGQSRYQTTLFPETLDELIPAEHPVRVIDAFVENLDLLALGFTHVMSEPTGRPGYAPGDLLKLYVYGYLNRVRSSRLLEQETRRNIEVLWLVNRLRPVYKTIADFRKDHPKAIVEVCRAFIRFCREQQLFGAELLAIDGTKIQAVASRKQVITPVSLDKKIAAIDQEIAEYLNAMDSADMEAVPAETKEVDVAQALEALKNKRDRLTRKKHDLVEADIQQQVATEPDSKLMRTAHHGFQVAYNAQTAVDAKHKLIAAFDLTAEGNDLRQLYPMATQGKEAMGAEKITTVSDSGYSNGKQGSHCEEAGITAIVPRAKTVNPKGEEYFTREEFTYDTKSDTYRCPSGQTLNRYKISQSEEKTHYRTEVCGSCEMKAKCTKADNRVIVRSFYEEAMQAMHQRATEDPAWMKQRRAIVEHPFGTLKWLMGYPRFLVRGLKKAKAELALGVLSYNLKRVINILGVNALLKALQPAMS